MASKLTEQIEYIQKELCQPIGSQEEALTRNNRIGELRGMLFALNYPTQQVTSLTEFIKTVKEKENASGTNH